MNRLEELSPFYPTCSWLEDSPGCLWDSLSLKSVNCPGNMLALLEIYHFFFPSWTFVQRFVFLHVRYIILNCIFYCFISFFFFYWEMLKLIFGVIFVPINFFLIFSENSSLKKKSCFFIFVLYVTIFFLKSMSVFLSHSSNMTLISVPYFVCAYLVVISFPWATIFRKKAFYFSSLIISKTSLS